MTYEFDQKASARRFKRWMDVRHTNGEQIAAEIGRSPNGVRKVSKTGNSTLETLFAVAKSQNERLCDLVGIMSGELLDSLDPQIELENEQNRDVLVASPQMSEAEVQNLQLMVRLLREIKEELVENRAILREIANQTSSEGKNKEKEGLSGVRKKVSTKG